MLPHLPRRISGMRSLRWSPEQACRCKSFSQNFPLSFSLPLLMKPQMPCAMWISLPHFHFCSLSLLPLFNISNWKWKSLRVRRCWEIRPNEKQVAGNWNPRPNPFIGVFFPIFDTLSGRHLFAYFVRKTHVPHEYIIYILHTGLEHLTLWLFDSHNFLTLTLTWLPLEAVWMWYYLFFYGQSNMQTVGVVLFPTFFASGISFA